VIAGAQMLRKGGEQIVDWKAHASFYCRNSTMFRRMISACG
jgi:hypothetical protein